MYQPEKKGSKVVAGHHSSIPTLSPKDIRSGTVNRNSVQYSGDRGRFNHKGKASSVPLHSKVLSNEYKLE